MFNQLTALGYGIIVFAILVGVGSVVLYNFGTSVSNCPTTSPTFNATNGVCTNSSGGGTIVTPGTAYQNVAYLTRNLGSTNGGLASWTPAIIAISVGLLFLGAFMINGSKKRRY
jgi:hypothetical protein